MKMNHHDHTMFDLLLMHPIIKDVKINPFYLEQQQQTTNVFPLPLFPIFIFESQINCTLSW